jgi:hypothetical protein
MSDLNEMNEIYAVAASVVTKEAEAKKTALGTPTAMHEEVTHFPLAKAVLCADCEAVSNGVRECPACGSTSLMNISKVMGGGGHGTLESPAVGPVTEAPARTPATASAKTAKVIKK